MKAKKIFLSLIFLLPLAFVTAGINNRDNSKEFLHLLDRKGDKAFQGHEIEKASRYWEYIIREAPDNIKIYNKLGISYLLLKRYDRAIDVFKKGLDIGSNNQGLRYNLALSYYYIGENEKAIKDIEEILRLNEYYPEAYYLKGLCLEKIGRMEDARKEYIQEINHNPGSSMAWQKLRIRVQ